MACSLEQLDAEGWSYQLTFSALRAAYRTGRAGSKFADMDTSLVRRRRMLRRAKLAGGRRHSIAVDFKSGATSPSKGKLPFRQAHGDSFESTLKYCRERRGLGEPIRVPWTQVLSVQACSPSLLVLLVELGKFTGSEKNEERFESTKVDVFVRDCCAASLKALIEDRTEFSPLRKAISRVVNFRRAPSHADSGADSDRRNAKMFALASHTLTELEDAMARVVPAKEPSRPALNAAPPAASPRASRPSIDRDSDVASQLNLMRERSARSVDPAAKMKEFRLRVYVAALLCNSLEAEHAFSLQGVAELARADVARMRERRCDSVGASLSAQVGYLRPVAAARIRNIYLTGWRCRKDDAFLGVLLHLIHTYLGAVVSAFGEYLDGPKSVMIYESSAKLEFLHELAAADTFLEAVLHDLLESYGMFLYPSPTVTNTLFEKHIISQFVTDVKRDFDDKFDRVLQGWHNRSTAAVPWKPLRRTRSGSNLGPYQTSIPDELRTAMLSVCDPLKLDIAEGASRLELELHLFRRRVELAYVSCFGRLAFLLATLLQRMEAAPLGSDSDGAAAVLAERQAWLCSVVNDCFRVSRDTMLSLAAPELASLKASHTAVLERTRAVYTAFDKVSVAGVEALSCLVFQKCAQHVAGFRSLWLASMRSGDDSPVAAILASLHESFQNLKITLRNLFDYKSLVKECATKVVILVLTFLRDLSAPLAHAERESMGADVQRVMDAFASFVDNVEAVVMSLSFHLKRLQDAFILVHEEPGSDGFAGVAKRLLGETASKHADPVATAALLGACLRARDWTAFESHRSQLTDLAALVMQSPSEPPQEGRKLLEFSAEVRVFRMPDVPLLTQIVHSQSAFVSTPALAPHEDEGHIGSRPDWTTCLSARRSVIKGLKVRGVPSVEDDSPPNVFVVFSTPLSRVATSVQPSNCNPSWYDDSFEVLCSHDHALIAKASLLVQVFLDAQGKPPVLLGSASIALNVVDELAGLSGMISAVLTPGPDRAPRMGPEESTKDSAASPKVLFSFSFAPTVY